MTYSEQIDEIMDCFDFGKVHKAIKALDWGWGLTNTVPEEHELRKQARQLLRYAAESPFPDYFTACGGLVARKSMGHLSLSFVVSSWDTFHE